MLLSPRNGPINKVLISFLTKWWASVVPTNSLNSLSSLKSNFEKVMKKNFTNIFILSILEKGLSHGYKIGNEIEKRTLGMWNPSASSLYWILNNLREKGFIILFEEDKNKKVYRITDTGREALRLMKLTQRKTKKHIFVFYQHQ